MHRDQTLTTAFDRTYADRKDVPYYRSPVFLLCCRQASAFSMLNKVFENKCFFIFVSGCNKEFLYLILSYVVCNVLDPCDCEFSSDQTDIKDGGHFLWNCHQVNATEFHWWLINIGLSTLSIDHISSPLDNEEKECMELRGKTVIQRILPFLLGKCLRTHPW